MQKEVPVITIATFKHKPGCKDKAEIFKSLLSETISRDGKNFLETNIKQVMFCENCDYGMFVPAKMWTFKEEWEK